jgi:DNA-binding NarL/FixJ family response regulator
VTDDEITVLVAVPTSTGTDPLVAALESTFEVTRRCGSLDLALEAAVETIPDVLVVHQGVGMDQFADFARRLYDSVPITRLVLLTDRDDQFIYECVRNGVFTIVSDAASTQQVVDATRSAARRESMIPAGVARATLEELTLLAERTEHAVSRPPRLTMTEQEVLSMLAQGQTGEHVAAVHDVTARLVNLHVGYAVAKLQLHLAQQRRLINR